MTEKQNAKIESQRSNLFMMCFLLCYVIELSVCTTLAFVDLLSLNTFFLITFGSLLIWNGIWILSGLWRDKFFSNLVKFLFSGSIN